MKMSDGEKLIVLMLSELYEHLGIEGEVDPEFIKSALFSDKLWGVNWKYNGIPFERSDDPPVVKEVVDILDMWSFVERTYDQLSPAEKEKIEEEVGALGKNSKFMGFDGNNETEYMATAMFLVNDLDRFQEFQGRSFNSHFPTLGMYQRMLDVFERKRAKLIYDSLSCKDLVEILKERVHPSQRE